MSPLPLNLLPNNFGLFVLLALCHYENLALLAAYIPYEQSERYAYGEHIAVPLLAAVGGIVCLGLMVWYIRKMQREKRQGRRKKRK
ncbi:MAG TPA: hypothetical protein VLT36_26485 [Candidatus Dormibacteraeota bacterium]|nr:hypothetical protein [Candidatus Dormibacteraeota bacterium]